MWYVLSFILGVIAVVALEALVVVLIAKEGRKRKYNKRNS